MRFSGRRIGGRLSGSPNASPTRAFSRRSVPSAARMTMPWPRPSTAYTRPNSSNRASPGAPSRKSNTRPPNGSTGFNHHHVYEYCGDIPPIEMETADYAQHRRPAAGRVLRTASGITGAFQSSNSVANSATGEWLLITEATNVRIVKKSHPRIHLAEDQPDHSRPGCDRCAVFWMRTSRGRRNGRDCRRPYRLSTMLSLEAGFPYVIRVVRDLVKLAGARGLPQDL